MAENEALASKGDSSEMSTAENEVAVQENAGSGDQNIAAATNATQQNQQQPSKLESFFAITKSLIIRALIIYFITSFFRRPASTPTVTNSSGQTVTRPPAWNVFPNGTIMDMYVYISEQEFFADFNNPSALFWTKRNLIYGDWSSGRNYDGTYSFSKKYVPSENVKNNGSVYLHAYVVKAGKSPDPKQKDKYDNKYVCYIKKMLNKFKKRKLTKTKNLLTGETQQSLEDQEKAKRMHEEIVSHWHPNLTLNLVTDQTNWVQGTVPAPLDEFIVFVDEGKHYKPVLFANDFWNMNRDYKPINTTVETLTLTLTFQPLSLFKWQIYSAQTMRNKWTVAFTGETFASSEEDDNDQDTLKETLLETSPYLLALTIIVSILHSVFELLAFKNDIQFWNNRKSLEGLSVRSVFFNVFQTLIVLLYVLDNDTNTIIRISCFIGLGIEIWKIHKVIDFKIDRERKIFGVLPRITFEDKGSYVQSSTREYDLMAFKYLSWVCFPLLAGYTIYSLLYLEHKGWYSFVLNMLYGFLLTFGFIMMTPQLFINYKLKSVAHLPWRMMSYKFLNTFIDDIFAFVIKMPTMYRLGCFRDDIVFFIFLYQRWIYKVDASRVNEFGFSGEMLEEAERAKQNQKTPAIQNKNTSDQNERRGDKKND